MELVTPTLLNLLWLPVALALFFLPGWMLARRFASPAPALAAFLGSAAMLFHLVFFLNATGLPLHVGTVATGLGAIAAALGWKLSRPGRRIIPSIKPTLPSPRAWFWMLAPLLAFTSIAVRAILDPLSGYDNGTRWDYLARLFLARQSMAGYPPFTADDFEFYSWCDGIPPLVPILNFWLYAATGSIAPVLTAVRVTGEAVLLGVVVFRYSRLLWGDSGGAPAVTALATSALGLWAISMGQETGLTAVALVSMLYFLELYARAPDRSLLIWAGIAAGVGSVTREYGLSFGALGLAVLFARRMMRSGGPTFIVTAVVLAAPWYVRNWVLTGNPLYPQTLGGLFPGNAVHNETMRYISDYWGLRTTTFSSIYILQALAVLGGLVGVFGLVGIARAGRRGFPLVGGIVLLGALWVWSIPQTAGGWIYSTRMLSPALALLAVLAGWMGTLRVSLQVACALVCIGGATDAARRSWLLPDFPLASALTPSFAPWKETHAALKSMGSHPVWDSLVRMSGGRGIVVDHPANHALVTMRNGTAIPLFSPLLSETFDDQISFEQALATLRSSRIRFVTISLKNPMAIRLVKAHPFWVELCLRHQPNAAVHGLGIFDLDQLVPSDTQVPLPSS